MQALSILFALNIIGASSHQAAIPPAQEGVEIGARGSSSRLDIFLDPHCPDCTSFFTLLSSILDSEVNGRKLRDAISINIHIFPWQFHRNSFLASIALNFFRTKHVRHFVDFLKIQLANVDKYNVDAKSLNQFKVQDLLIEDAKKAFGSDDSSDADQIFTDPSFNSGARVTLKYGDYRGVTATPFVLINQVAINDVPENKDDLLDLFSKYIDGSASEL